MGSYIEFGIKAVGHNHCSLHMVQVCPPKVDVLESSTQFVSRWWNLEEAGPSARFLGCVVRPPEEPTELRGSCLAPETVSSYKKSKAGPESLWLPVSMHSPPLEPAMIPSAMLQQSQKAQTRAKHMQEPCS